MEYGNAEYIGAGYRSFHAREELPRHRSVRR
jgi:hypothetical protein